MKFLFYEKSLINSFQETSSNLNKQIQLFLREKKTVMKKLSEKGE